MCLLANLRQFARDAPVGDIAMWHLVIGWAALGVALSPATQLRASGLPIGPSEVVLLGWMLFVSFLLLRGAPFSSGRLFSALAAYWASALTLMGFGTLIAINTHKFNVDLGSHDAFAFIYISLFTCFLCLRLGDKDQYHLKVARMTLLFTVFAAGLLLGISKFAGGFGRVTLLDNGIRFQGWADNPNQMALAVVAMPFLSCYLIRRARRFMPKVIYVVAIAICALVGIATESDALRVSWALTVCGLLGLLWCKAIFRGRGPWLYLSHILAPALIVILGVFTGEKLSMALERIAETLYNQEGGQGSLRLTVWHNGLRAISESPLVGFGPGSFSGVQGPFSRWEAHNSLIDWGMSTGILGILLLIALWSWCLLRAIKSGSAPLLGVMTSIILFSLFHYILRQPIYWAMLVLVLRLSEQPTLSAAPDARAVRTRLTKRVALPGQDQIGVSVAKPTYVSAMRRRTDAAQRHVVIT